MKRLRIVLRMYSWRVIVGGWGLCAGCQSDRAVLENPSATAGASAGAAGITTPAAANPDAGRASAGAGAPVSDSGAATADASAPPPDAGTQSVGDDDAAAMPAAESGSPGQHDLSLCSGCPSEKRDPADSAIRVHHVHMNVKSVAETAAFYARYFGTRTVWLNDKAEALWAEPLLLILDEVHREFPDRLQMGLEHFGMGVKDPVAWFQQASAQGLQADPRNDAPATPQSLPIPAGSTPFVDPDVDTFAYIYVRGPSSERIEVWSGLKQFRHIHFMTPDIDQTVDWYSKLLARPPVTENAAANLGTGNGIAFDDGLQMYFASQPPIDAFVATDDRPVGHIAFSVPALDAMFERAKQMNVTIVSDPAETPQGFRSFFVRAPQQVLVEFVEAGPITF